MNTPSFINWSGGLDSALALYFIRKTHNLDIQALLISANTAHKRISMHGVSEDLLRAQSDALEIPLEPMDLPEMPSVRKYNHAMNNALQWFLFKGIKKGVFGDVDLEEIREYRDGKLRKAGMEGLYPLWKRDKREVVKDFLDLGFKAITVCTKVDTLDQSFSGREVDKAFLNDLPDKVDPCGENGEFHTFVYDGPIFKQPILVEVKEPILRTYEVPESDLGKAQQEDVEFWYSELSLKK